MVEEVVTPLTQWDIWQMLKAIDDWLFDRVFQPALNVLPGASPVETGRFFLTGAVLAALWNIGAHPQPPQAAMWLIAAAACCYLYLAFGRLSVGRGRNFMRVAPGSLPVRVFFAGVAACDLLTAGHGPAAPAAFNTLMLLALYLGACDAPPPRERRAALGRFALQT